MSKALDRLSKLIAQADNAGTDAERETYMARAVEMSAAVGVELTVARAHHAAKRRELPVKDHKVQVSPWAAKPIHRQAMMDLFLAIAEAHDIQCLIGGGNYTAYCAGFPSDIELAEKLFGALSLQMVREADAAIKRGDQKSGYYPVDGRVYRRYFYESFTARISGRLYAARRKEIERIDEKSGQSGGTELVLRNKSAEVTALHKEAVEYLRVTGRLSRRGYTGLEDTNEKNYHYSGAARTHGSQAADRADIGLHDRDMAGATRPEL